MGKKTKIDWCDRYQVESKVLTSQGYVLVKCPNHPNANKGRNKEWMFEHRFVMSKFMMRALRDDEVVHHKNGVKNDNRIENLELLTNSEHMKHHGKTQSEERLEHFKNGRNAYLSRIRKSRELAQCACGCGMLIEKHDSKGRLRTFAHGHNQRGQHWKRGASNGV